MTFASALLGSAVSASTYAYWDSGIATFGYTYTAHEITTDDNYIITAFRITGDSNGSFTPDKPPVVVLSSMQYDAALSIVASSSSTPDVDPYYLKLAKAGYDVFMLNNRGT